MAVIIGCFLYTNKHIDTSKKWCSLLILRLAWSWGVVMADIINAGQKLERLNGRQESISEKKKEKKERKNVLWVIRNIVQELPIILDCLSP